eukprot:365134-Amphidinium_carterae.1
MPRISMWLAWIPLEYLDSNIAICAPLVCCMVDTCKTAFPQPPIVAPAPSICYGIVCIRKLGKVEIGIRRT